MGKTGEMGWEVHVFVCWRHFQSQSCFCFFVLFFSHVEGGPFEKDNILPFLWPFQAVKPCMHRISAAASIISRQLVLVQVPGMAI